MAKTIFATASAGSSPASIEGEVRVIATGGGAFVDPRTRKLLNERAITVWLDAPVDILAERTSRRDTRAQLRNGDPKATLERLSAERRPSYEEAHIHVKSGDGAHKDVVDSIIAALENYVAAPRRGLAAFVGKRAIGAERQALPGMKIAGRALPLEPLAVAHPIFAVDALDLVPWRCRWP